MNKITIGGHLGSDPEVRHTTNGQKVTSFNVAVNSRKQNKEETFWYRLTIFGDRFDKMLTYLKKGSGIIATGDLYPSIWKNENKPELPPKLNLEIIVDSIQFSPFGRSTGEREGQTSTGGYAPKQGYSQATPYAANPVAPSNGFDNLDSYVEGFGATYGSGAQDDSKDDLPF